MIHTHRFLLACCIVGAACGSGYADSLQAESLRGHRLIRQAEQLAEAGALAESTNLLEQVLEDTASDRGASPARLRAKTLLASNYFESGLYRKAIHHAVAVLPAPSDLTRNAGSGLLEHTVDSCLLLARAHNQLGHAERAASNYRRAVEYFNRLDDEPSIRRLRQRSQLLTVQQRLEGHPAASDSILSAAAPDFQRFPEEHYSRALRVWVEGLIERGQPAEAVEILDSEGLAAARVSQSLGYRSLAELHGLKMTALSDAARRVPGGLDPARSNDAANDTRGVLSAWHRDLLERVRTSGGAPGIAHLQELASLCSLEADWCERRAIDLLRQTPPDLQASGAVWEQAARTLDRLRQLVGVLATRAEELEITRPEAAQREAVRHFAEQRLDRALAGVQRVLLRLKDRGDAPDSQPPGLLGRVSAELVALRNRRLLPDDPHRLEARMARAFVLAASGAHDKAIPEFRSTLQRIGEGNPSARFTRAQASLGLGMSLLARHRFAEAGEHLTRARVLASNVPANSPRHEQLDQQSDAALGYLAMLQGEYRSAAERLTRLSSQEGSAAPSESDSVRSTAKVFLALLRKAEADYAASRRHLAEGRLLSESPFVGTRHTTAYDLTEVALLLTEALNASQSQVRDERLRRADALLRRVEQHAGGATPKHLVKPLAVLRSQLFALRGDRARAQEELQPLASDPDPVTRARAFLGLSRLERMARPVSGGKDTDTLKSSLAAAENAVRSLATIDAGAYPSLTFQANSEAAWLLDALDRAGAAPPPPVAPSGQGVEQASAYQPLLWGDQAIVRLEAAIRVAERPASENTRDNQGRSQFFTRYAPAYDLLVSQHVRRAERLAGAGGDRFSAAKDTDAYKALVRAMEVSDLARNRTFRESVGVIPTEAEPTAGWLPELVGENEALLVYHLGGMRWRSKRYRDLSGSDGEGFLFIVTDGGATIACQRLTTTNHEGEKRSLSRSAAAALVSPYLRVLGQHPDERGDLMARHYGVAKACTDAVLPKAARERLRRSEGVQRLMIVPDGPLHQLPFEALIFQDQGRRSTYALDSLPPIAYGPSLSVLLRLDRSEPSRTRWDKIVSYGAPEYAETTDEASRPYRRLARHLGENVGLEDLAHAEAEVAGVMSAFSRAGLGASLVQRTGAAATEASFVREARGATLVHVAAHGFAERESTEVYALLAMTPNGTSDTADDGLLHLEELGGLSLDGCELAILSACETLVGVDRPLEAGMSLTRALLERKARRVVSSHWKVADRATSLLVPSFCEGLLGSTPSRTTPDYATALHSAKQRLRSGDLAGAKPGQYSDPYYWAPLVLVGAP